MCIYKEQNNKLPHDFTVLKWGKWHMQHLLTSFANCFWIGEGKCNEARHVKAVNASKQKRKLFLSLERLCSCPCKAKRPGPCKLLDSVNPLFFLSCPSLSLSRCFPSFPSLFLSPLVQSYCAHIVRIYRSVLKHQVQNNNSKAAHSQSFAGWFDSSWVEFLVKEKQDWDGTLKQNLLSAGSKHVLIWTWVGSSWAKWEWAVSKLKWRLTLSCLFFCPTLQNVDWICIYVGSSVPHLYNCALLSWVLSFPFLVLSNMFFSVPVAWNLLRLNGYLSTLSSKQKQKVQQASESPHV